jgi:predicted DNA-binding transcriptional regulator AlpA
MARHEVTGKKPGVNRLTPPPPRLAFGILEFCTAVGISEDFFYKLKRQGQAPRLLKIGARTMVSVQAANEWLVERERETASAEAEA